MGFMNSIFRISYFILFLIAFSFLLTVNAQTTRRYFTGDNTSENEFNKISKSAQRVSRALGNMPPSFSLKQFAPVPRDQGEHGTCVAWSTGYAARTISYCIAHN